MKDTLRDTLRDMLRRDPFNPFRIVLSSGREYVIDNPDLVAVGQTQINVYHQASDKFDILRLNQIASFEVLEPAA